MTVYSSHIKTDTLRGAVNHRKCYYSCEYRLHVSVLLTILGDLDTCLMCIVDSFNCLVCNYCWLAMCIVVVVLCVLLSSYVYLLYYVCIAVFYFRCRTAG